MAGLPNPRSASVGVATFQPVLLVDDLVAGAASAEVLLAAAGYQVATESRGDAVLRLVRTMYMRMVVTELHVPCGEGTCVATILRGERRRYPRLRVIALTRHCDVGDHAWMLAAGCDVVIAKLDESALLVREVRRLDDYSIPVISLPS